MRLPFVLAFVGLLAFNTHAFGDESNQKEVRANIAKGGWKVYYGEKITEAEYLTLIVLIKTGDPTQVP